jgi:hypothetical protein
MNFACLIKFAFMDCREAYHPHCVGEEDRLRSSEDWFVCVEHLFFLKKKYFNYALYYSLFCLPTIA